MTHATAGLIIRKPPARAAYRTRTGVVSLLPVVDADVVHGLTQRIRAGRRDRPRLPAIRNDRHLSHRYDALVLVDGSGGVRVHSRQGSRITVGTVADDRRVLSVVLR